VSEERRPDWFGVILGASVFLVGIALLIFTFIQAARLFGQSPSELIQRENAEITQIGASMGEVILRIGLLLMMSVVGSMISSRGVKMYLAARAGLIVQKD
jgi:hypothetical protein